MGYRSKKYVAAMSGLVAALLIGVVIVLSPSVLAQTGIIQEGVNSVSDGSPSTPLMSTVGTLINVLLFLIGAVSVVMIIFGGFKYVTSAGESSAVSSAKNTILYAVVGLIVAVSAYAIVSFFLSAANPPTSWAECMEMDDLTKRKQCQIDMIEADAPDVPTEAIRDGVIDK